MSNYKSQYDQDRYCYENFLKHLPCRGVFVEVGASDGIKLSNTYFYEKELGWSGLCIEPREKAFKALTTNRNCFCEKVGIAPNFEDGVEFQDIEGWGEGLSGIVKNYDPRHQNIIEQRIIGHPENKGRTLTKIRTVPLRHLLDKYNISHINFLSVDTEGGELNILKSIDWNKTKVDVITVENNYGNSSYFRDYLREKGLVFVTKLEIDEIYVHRDFFRGEDTTVAFISTWADPKQLLQEYSSTLPNGKNWVNLRGIDNIDEADVCVVMEGASNEDIFKSNKTIICLPREPIEVNPVKHYTRFHLPYGYTYENIYHCVPQFNFLCMDINKLLNLECIKQFSLSCVVSAKCHTHGAKQRVDFVRKVQETYPQLMDVFGRGMGQELDNKQPALIPYRYSLCMENSQHPNYFTEKFTDAIVCWCIPIYWGCPNISEYFPKDSYYYLDITKDGAVEELKRIVEEPITRDNIAALSNARNLIFSKYNIWGTIQNILKV